ncbi:MAG: bifunctional phosphopantothenoylcysteine decarboxylase/phosphopantothenate--cysteine ligase CoaBC [Gemmatimonadota bacterium]|nr:bifunctional phosphopantothenoylcysteine decarboxylase/phosphopantothenate--cysteine ligase CoaBC [Gemmatimonadota bacterium]
MRPFDSQRVLLGVTGGIASYKAAWLARLLTQAGAEVDVVMTRSATEFIGAITFEALTGRPVHTQLIQAGHALDHIKLARAASVVVIAPATADFIARAVGGHADDLLSACLLANTSPVLLVPAMNDRMWAHVQVQHNIDAAKKLGYHVLPPDDGALAVGEGHGPGRMPEPETILAYVARLLETSKTLQGKRVVVTAGPTREPIDPVRFMSNRSSGRMGVEVASAAWRRGAEVTLIAGPLEVALPAGINSVHVETTADMQHAVIKALENADALIMSAAPADFTSASPAEQKIKKQTAPDVLQLARTPDILKSSLLARKSGAIIVGFALETQNALNEGTRKLREKGLDLVVVNDATEPGAGFGVTTNRVTFVNRAGEVEALPLLSKREVADAIWDRVEILLHGR